MNGRVSRQNDLINAGDDPGDPGYTAGDWSNDYNFIASITDFGETSVRV